MDNDNPCDRGMADFLLGFLNHREAELQAQIELGPCKDCSKIGPQISNDEMEAAQAVRNESIRGLLDGTAWASGSAVKGHGLIVTTVRRWE